MVLFGYSGFYTNNPYLYDITEHFLKALNTHNRLTGNIKLRTENVLIYIYVFYLEIYPFTTGATTRYTAIFTNDT